MSVKTPTMFKVLFRLVVSFFLLFQYGELLATDSVYLFKEAHIQLEVNSHWHLQPRQEQNGFIIYVFKRDPVFDSLNRKIIPNAAVVIEKIDPKMDVVAYSVNKRASGAFSVTQVFNHEDGIIRYVNAIGYKGTYTDQMDHIVYVVHAINEGEGMQIILDTTSETFPALEAEFLQILKSIRT